MRYEIPEIHHLADIDILVVLENEVDPDLTEGIQAYRHAVERMSRRRLDQLPVGPNQRQDCTDTEAAMLDLLRTHRAEAEAWLNRMANGRPAVNYLRVILDGQP